jgi:acyl-CoA thioesterase-1
MTAVIFFFGSGLAFFAGAALVLIAVLMAALKGWRVLPRLAPLTAILGMILVACSAAPLPNAFYLVVAIATLGWLAAEHFRKKIAARRLALLRVAVALLWLAGVAIELPYHFVPAVAAMGGPEVWIVGDSVTAGVGDHKTETWPRILARKHGVVVHDRSQMGATVGSKLEKEPLGDGIVLLEIGGNDLLGTTTAADYEDRLERLLALVCRGNRTVLMFELPLPPFCNEYGRVQRRLAAASGVALIPKRVFVGVLTQGDATLDSVHLSQRGHQEMAEVVWRLIQGAYTP